MIKPMTENGMAKRSKTVNPKQEQANDLNSSVSVRILITFHSTMMRDIMSIMTKIMPMDKLNIMTKIMVSKFIKLARLLVYITYYIMHYCTPMVKPNADNTKYLMSQIRYQICDIRKRNVFSTKMKFLHLMTKRHILTIII